MSELEPPVEVWVRATINLPGLHQGQEALVDPSIEYIAAALENRYLITIDDPYGEDEHAPAVTDG